MRKHMRGLMVLALSMLVAGVAGGASAQETEAALPARNVRLVFQLIEADGFQTTDPEIEDVVEELREIFRFNGYRLLTTSIANTVLAERSSSVAQRLVTEQLGTFELHANVRPADATARNLLVSVSMVERTLDDYAQVLDVSVNLRDGQTVVLGSAATRGGGGALILAVRAQFLD